ncbi:MAG: YqjF family protein [Bacteroidia bacterium]
MEIRDILDVVDHRPFPLPKSPWVMQQTWVDLLFAHWKIPYEIVQRRLPSSLELDTHQGDAYIAVTPFKMRDVRFRLLPPIPTATDFLEVNVRTYVKKDGKPGIFFFSLDASSTLSTVGARLGTNLPYHRADMSVKESDNKFIYSSYRKDEPAELEVSYQPLSEIFESKPGSLEEFLTERYCLFQNIGEKKLIEIDIHHLKWQLQQADAIFTKNSITRPAGIKLPEDKPLLHYSKTLKVAIFPVKFIA